MLNFILKFYAKPVEQEGINDDHCYKPLSYVVWWCLLFSDNGRYGRFKNCE